MFDNSLGSCLDMQPTGSQTKKLQVVTGAVIEWYSLRGQNLCFHCKVDSWNFVTTTTAFWVTALCVPESCNISLFSHYSLPFMEISE